MATTQQGDPRKIVAINRPPRADTSGCSASLAERFLVDLQQASAGQTALSDLLKSLAGCVRKLAPCLGLWYIENKADGSIDKAHSLMGADGDAEGALLWQTFHPQFVAFAQSVSAQQSLASKTLEGKPGLTAVAQPVLPGETSRLLLGLFDDSAAIASEKKHRSPSDYQWIISHVARSVETWELVRRARLLEAKARSFADAAKLNLAIDASQNRLEACMTLGNGLRTVMQCSQVAVALCDSGKQKPKLVAVSDVESFDKDNPACQAMVAVMEKALESGRWLGWSEQENDPSLDGVSSDREMSDYCAAAGCEACLTLCVKDANEETFGAILLGGMQNMLDDEAQLSHLKQIMAIVGGHLAVVLKSHRHPVQVAKCSLHKILRQRKTKVIASCALLICGILAIPWPIKIACHSEMQPVLRRFVAAPHDGILEAALVESGAIVQQGQLLARLDGRQIRIELASRKAELNSQRKQRDSALAVQDVAKSQIASLEMKRLEAEIDLLDQRLENLVITSPIDGVVLNGDLEKAEGAPLSMGQNLFEISPLDELLAEIAIPESEIQYVQEQMQVAVKLDAYPFEKWTGTIEKIHPRAEIVDDQSVFIAEVRMANDKGLIKPGMKGSASIRGDRYPLAWALVRRPWEQIRGWLIW